MGTGVHLTHTTPRLSSLAGTALPGGAALNEQRACAGRCAAPFGSTLPAARCSACARPTCGCGVCAPAGPWPAWCCAAHATLQRCPPPLPPPACSWCPEELLHLAGTTLRLCCAAQSISPPPPPPPGNRQTSSWRTVWLPAHTHLSVQDLPCAVLLEGGLHRRKSLASLCASFQPC